MYVTSINNNHNKKHMNFGALISDAPIIKQGS